MTHEQGGRSGLADPALPLPFQPGAGGTLVQVLAAPGVLASVQERPQVAGLDLAGSGRA
ncbi:hypothetical protein [Streptomyces cirratus]|uniref:hypothetical protein n=1 Tax=Streptomyces cirratus TaxID=68187 RepID=UPI003609A8A8